MKKIIIFILFVISIMMTLSIGSAATVDIDATDNQLLLSGSPTTAVEDLRIYRYPSTATSESLLEFYDLSSIPATATVSSATLYLYVGYNDYGDGSTFGLERVTSSWNNATVTYNTAPTTTYVSSFTITGDYYWKSKDITTIVDGWHESSFNNYGLFFDSFPASGDGEVYFDEYDEANNPYIRVVYSLPNNPPTQPTLGFPANDTTSNVSTWNLNATSTDADADPITYYFYGDVVDGTTLLGTSSGNYSWDVSTFAKHYWKVRAHDGTEFGAYSDTFDFTFTAGIPTLSAPTNNTVKQYGYPPSIYDMNFSWSDTTAPQYNIKISLVSDFSTLVYDSNVNTNSATKTLENNTYYWKVASYDGVTTGTYSATFNLTMALNETGYQETGGVDGIVYKVSGTDLIALSGAIVSVWNSTYSNTMTTGVDGYYLFEDLANGSYNVQATKGGFQDSFIGLVEVVEHNWTSHSIYLSEISGYGEYYVEHFVIFTVSNVWLTRFEGVTATVYIGDSYDVVFTDTTDNKGQVTFNLNEDVKYRITFIDVSQGINEVYYAYPTDTSYWIITTTASWKWETYDIPARDAITISVTKDDYSALQAWINVSYFDSTSGTNGVSFYLNQTDGNDPANQSTVLFIDSGQTNNVTEAFELGSHNGESYIVHVRIDHADYGIIHKYYAVTFVKTSIYDGIPGWFFYGFGMFLIFICGGLALSVRSEEVFLLMCTLGWILYYAGWFNYYNPDSIALGLTIATLLGIAEFLNKSKEER